MSTANIIIPAKNAGIGDLVYGTRADHIIIARGTANAATINGKNIYGGIYGFVAGMAMVCAPKDFGSTKQWGTFVTGMPTFGSGTTLMRNGLKTDYYTQMNTARQMASDGNRGMAGDIVHPTAAYYSGIMTKSTFETGTSNNDKLARSIYGTWEEYLRQTLRVNGVPGSPFGATTTGVKVHEFGRWMAHTYGKNQTAGTAMRDCYDYAGPSNTDSAGTWWLPSMFELAELMIDDHYNKLNENKTASENNNVETGWGDITNSSYRWSCVCNSSSHAWGYSGAGVSDRIGVTSAVAVRPVTLLKL